MKKKVVLHTTALMHCKVRQVLRNLSSTNQVTRPEIIFVAGATKNWKPTIVSTISGDFLIVKQVSFHHKWNEVWLLLTNYFKWVTSRVAEQLKTWDLR